MSARDYDLAQPVAADEQAPAPARAASPALIVPASPPPRNPVEDADASFTRKRPRLDSGSNSIRAMSADTTSSARDAAASPTEQQVEMTIRVHPSSSPATAQVESGHDANDFLEDPQLAQHRSPILIASTEDDRDSPPVMLIDDDDEEVAFSVHLDAEDYFHRFPYPTLGNYSHAVREIPQYIQGCMSCSLLPLTLDLS
jgi:ubiquitin carboxyl-terminal hydrolase 34